MISRQRHRSDTQAIALIGVLVIVGLLSMIALSLMYRMSAAATSSATTLPSEQAWAAALSGLDRATSVVSDPTRTPISWLNNSTEFEHQMVYDDGSDKWYFSVFRQGNLESGEIAYGVTDLASKLPLPLTNVIQMMEVPNMTLPVVEALADFVDTDSIARDNGAEQEVYDMLPVAYSIPNQQVSFLDELLLAHGVTAGHLYGEDANRNFKLDSNENDGELHSPPDNQDSALAGGLHRYFTLHSRDWNVSSDNQRRVNLNDPEKNLSETELDEELIEFIQAKRSANEPIMSLADLVGASVTITEEGNINKVYNSGVTVETLHELINFYTLNPDEFLPGKVNINTAPANILAQIPGIDENLATTIASTRTSINPEQSRSIAWLIESGTMSIDQFKQLERYLTARSFQFHVQVVGYGLPSGRFRRLEAMIDLIGGSPRIIYLRDLTKLGVPYHFSAQQGMNLTQND
ncbi:MAG: hypothetical protein CMO63_06830 [Verrucomicrobiales bacterium]|nr:hypothetical protein [Verrucomicrobiales bacterium]